MKKTFSVLILCFATLGLPACAILNLDTGPCYGNGCPAYAPKSAPAPQTTAQNTSDTKTQNKRSTKNSAAADSQTKRGE
jgi:hypothetical protein